MNGIPREKIALVVFVACIMLILIGIASYLVAGHSWNYAATRIDDAAGEMDGYTVVLYEGTAIPRSSRVDGHGLLTTAPVSLAAVERDYREKGADVCILDLMDPGKYDEPIIIGKEGYRMGVVHIPTGTLTVQAQAKVNYLRSHDVDIVIAIVPAQETIAKVEGIDVFVDLNESSAFASGESSAQGYRISMPEVGTVDAITISPSEVVSARTITG